MSKAKLLAVLACASSLFAGNVLAATPLTRYFPDFPLAVIEAKDLQESIGQTGSFGEDTQVFLGKLFDEAIRSEFSDELDIPPALRNAAVRTLVASIRDIAAAGYGVGNNIEYLAAVRFTPKNFVTTALSKAFNSEITSYPAARKLREGNYLATVDGGFSVGVGNNILYLSSNKDLLRGYLKRLNGQALPTLNNGAAYRSVMTNTGDGFLKEMINFTAIAQVLSRSRGITQRDEAALRTLNLMGGSAKVVTDGLEARGVTLLNPSGGDAALLKLLTYPAPDQLELLSDLPSTAPSASVMNVDSIGWLEYAQSWLSEAGLSKSARRDATDVFNKLKTRLGNEWGVVTTNRTDSSAVNLVRGWYGGVASVPSPVSSSAPSSALSYLRYPDPNTYYYAKTQDGQQVLDDLETALTGLLNDGDFATSDGTAPTIERTEIGGFETLMLSTVGKDRQGKEVRENLLIVNKNDTIVIGVNIDALEGYLSAPPLLENEYFAALEIPANVTGVQFIAPIRLTRQEINQNITEVLKALDASKSVPASLQKAYGDWYESYASRTLPSYGYSSVDGNKLISYGKNGFLWNK